MNFEIIHKPTFTNQLLAIPKEQVVQVLEKIEVLRQDPKPHGSLKKKLHGYKGDVYRLRSGDWRIIYTYGDGWVALLGVDARKDVYKGTKLVAETPELDVSALTTLDQVLTPLDRSTLASDPGVENLLPNQISADLLTRLRIPTEFFSILLPCRTLDDLLAAKIPSELRDRVFDCITAPNFDQVLTQPSFSSGGSDDLLRFTEGELMGFLLKLNPEQEKFVTWAIDASGPTLLKGGPGTGKSTVALYRVKALIQTLRANGIPKPKILFTTYTNALVSFSQQLLENLLGSDIQYVEVKTADSLIYSLIHQSSSKPQIPETSSLKTLLKQSLSKTPETLTGNALQIAAQNQILARLSQDYLLEEITSVIEARGLTTLADYQSTPRTGRTIPLNKIQRQAIWQLRIQFNQLLAEKEWETWPQLRNRALDLLNQMPDPPVYDAVLIDETQDLDPNALRFLVKLCRLPNRLFVTADANQSIYGSGFRWTDIQESLKFAGRTGILKTNHRTTKEINEAAFHYLRDGILDEELTERIYVHSGPPPAVRAIHNRFDEGELVIRFCKAAAHEFRLGIGACAILSPTEKTGRRLAEQITYLGAEAEFMSSRELDLNRPGIKILTLKAAKGLEFPIVVLAGFLESPYPSIPKGVPDSEKVEILTRERRTLFVAMTRAMRALLVVIPAEGASLVMQPFDPQFWNIGQKAVGEMI